MKAPATTTQMEATPGNAVQRRTPSNSSVGSTRRTPSPELREETETNFNPPTYDGPTIPLPEEKEIPNGQSQQSTRRQSSAVVDPESHSFPLNNSSQPPPENFTLPVAEVRCDFLPNRSAVWVVKDEGLKISTLGAAILLNDGILNSKDLRLYIPFSHLV